MAAKKKGSPKKAKAAIVATEPIVVPFPFAEIRAAVPEIEELETYRLLLDDAAMFEEQTRQLNDECRVLREQAKEIELVYNRLNLDLEDKAKWQIEQWKLDPRVQDEHDKAKRTHTLEKFLKAQWVYAQAAAETLMPAEAALRIQKWTELVEQQRRVAAKKEEADQAATNMRNAYKKANDIRIRLGLGKDDPTDAILQEAGLPVSAQQTDPRGKSGGKQLNMGELHN